MILKQLSEFEKKIYNKKVDNPVVYTGSQIQLDPSVYTQGNAGTKLYTSFLAILIITVVPLI